MRRVCIAAFALLGLAACRTEDKSDEVLGAERPGATMEPNAAVTMMPAAPAPPQTAPQDCPPSTKAKDPVARPNVVDSAPPPPWMRERAEDRAPSAPLPRADEPRTTAPPPPRPQDEKPDKAPDSQSPLPKTTPPEEIPQPPNIDPPGKYPPSVPPAPPVPGEMPNPVPLKPR